MMDWNDPSLMRWRLHLRADPETVYQALATDRGREQYWAETSREQDDRIAFCFPDGQVHTATVTTRRPPHRFELEYFGSPSRFDLRADGAGGTDLELTVGQVPADDHLEVAGGWVSVLMALKAAVDHGVDLRNHDPNRHWGTGYVDN